MRPNRLFSLMLLVVLVLTASCSQPAAPATTAGATTAPAAAAPAAAAKVTIRLATWAGVEEAKELQAVIDKINSTATA
ncbi:MAG: hypothetical protein GX616_25750, partial [Planctomycetes bacterium]|nr:hypothetical protein [Planctomycetota bacterium]